MLLAKGQVLDEAGLEQVPPRQYREIRVEGDGRVEQKLEQLSQQLEDDIHNIEAFYRDKVAKITKGMSFLRA